MPAPIVLESTAILSKDGVYRYLLTRTWRAGGETACFVMLNPSSADAALDDPTIRRCMRFAADWGFGSLAVVNLFAYRTSNPNELLKAPDPCGAENLAHIHTAVATAAKTIVAWGVHGRRAPKVSDVLDAIPNPLCLGITQCGSPRHPLYTRGDTTPLRYAVHR